MKILLSTISLLVTLNLQSQDVIKNYKKCYESGKVMETGKFKNDLKDGEWVRYNEDGTLSAKGYFILGKKSGIWLVYDEKGNKRYEMEYTDGVKTGTWTIWDENGYISMIKEY